MNSGNKDIAAILVPYTADVNEDKTDKSVPTMELVTSSATEE